MPPISKASRTLRLVVVEGEDAGTSVDVRERRSIGTSDRSDLVLTDRTVSRRHMTVEPSALGLRVRDQGSRNGTWSGSERLYDAELAEGAELRVGNTRLRIETSDVTPARDDAPALVRESFGRFVGTARAVQPLYASLDKASASTASPPASSRA